MEVKDWPEGVNTDVYGMGSGWVDNRVEVKYKSGRKIYYRKNSVELKTHAAMMKFDDSNIIARTDSGTGLTEWNLFTRWFESTIMGGTLPFRFPDLSNKGVGTKVYYLRELPEGKGQRTKEVSLSFEEA